MAEWPSVPVHQLQDEGVLWVEDGNHGEYRPRPDEFVDEGIAFIRAADMSNRGIDFARASKISPVARERVRKGIGRDGDVLLSHKGTVGRVAIVPDGSPQFVCSPQTTFWRSLDSNRLDRHYLRYFLESPGFVRQLDARKGETDMAAYVSLTEQRKLLVALPPVDEQRAIADALSALDDKIESNRRISRLIDGFLPLLLPVGDGTDESVRLTGVADLQKGVSYRSAELEPSSTAMVSLKCFGRTGDFQRSGLKEYIGTPKPAQIVEPGEVVVAQTDLTQGAEVVGRALRIPSTTGYDRLVASLDLIIVRPNADIEIEYLYGLLCQERFRQHCRSRTSGTTVLHLAADALPSYRFHLPSSEARAEYVATVRPLLDRRDQLGGESDTLAALRDTLLPELLSGRLRVPEAEDLVADAG